MKTLKAFAIIVLCSGLLFGSTSCAVFITENSDQHKGWFKNPNNPHHPFSTNPGQHKGNKGNPKK
jgi:ABC-type oligopeptide transport system substrate-binding subunit